MNLVLFPEGKLQIINEEREEKPNQKKVERERERASKGNKNV